METVGTTALSHNVTTPAPHVGEQGRRPPSQYCRTRSWAQSTLDGLLIDFTATSARPTSWRPHPAFYTSPMVGAHYVMPAILPSSQRRHKSMAVQCSRRSLFLLCTTEHVASCDYPPHMLAGPPPVHHLAYLTSPHPFVAPTLVTSATAPCPIAIIHARQSHFCSVWRRLALTE